MSLQTEPLATSSASSSVETSGQLISKRVRTCVNLRGDRNGKANEIPLRKKGKMLNGRRRQFCHISSFTDGPGIAILEMFEE